MNSSRTLLTRPEDTPSAAGRPDRGRTGKERDRWIDLNRYYHRSIEELCRAVIPAGSSVLVLGSQTGNLLPALEADPATSAGVEATGGLVETARAKYPAYRFEHCDPEDLGPVLGDQLFDHVVLLDLVGQVDDLQRTFTGLHCHCHPGTRLVVTYYNFIWEPALRLAEKIGLKMPQPEQNWLSMTDIASILALSDFPVDRAESALLVPRDLPGAAFLNRIAPRNPVLRHLCLVQYFCATHVPPDGAVLATRAATSVSVVVPCRNEVGNIEAAVRRIPEMGSHTEIVFVDGQSTDGTVEKIEAVIEAEAGRRDVKLIHQVSRTASEATGEQADRMLALGKGDAVRKAFAVASGDILMILDADLTVPPEDLPKFFYPLADRKVDFANGCRLVYPMQDEAMRFVNLVGNRVFGFVFSWLLGQPVKDTLCGTKALLKRDYQAIVANRSHFGDFDPFGDFDLLFGAARLRLQIADIPIRYRRRTAGLSKVSVLRHGVLLLRMTLIGFQRLKLARWMGH